jgi:hypothetical protein
VLIEKVDGIDLEPLERSLDTLLDVLGPTVQAALPAVQVEPELRGDDDLLAERKKGFADELFVRERAVDLRGIEERDTTLDSRANQRDHRLLVGGRAVAEAHRHAAESESRDFQVVVSKCSLLHCVSVQSSIMTLSASRSFIAR